MLTILVIVLILKPQKPIFTIQAVKIESYKFDIDLEDFATRGRPSIYNVSGQKISDTGDEFYLREFSQIKEKELFVSSVISMNLSGVNPNKFGINYGTLRFHVLEEGLTIGMIRILRFYQPPKSKGINVPAQVMFECVDVSKLIQGNSANNGISSQLRILGDVRARVRIPHFALLPSFKVLLILISLSIYIFYKKFWVLFIIILILKIYCRRLQWIVT